jgi:Domain of unknown function (DUF4082)
MRARRSYVMPPLIRHRITVHIAVAVGVMSLVAGVASMTAAQPTVAAYSIWPDSVVPVVAADPESTSVVLGTRFVSRQPGSVTAIRFYRSPANLGPHVGSLWSSDGKKLASVSFPSSVRSGWQTAQLEGAVQIDSGKIYTVSYRALHGRYADDQWAFDAGKAVSTRDLTALAGVYTYGDGMPRQVWNGSNYYVDVIFQPAPTTTTSAPAPSSTTTATTTSTATTTAPTTKESATTSTTAPQPSASQPNPSNTGVPAGWAPKQTRTTDLRVTTAGAVVEDVRLVNADLVVDAPNVTVRRVEIQGGQINNAPGTTCRNGLVLEDVSMIRSPGQVTTGATPAIQVGSYIARRVKIDGLPEGFRAGGKAAYNCGPVTVQDSFARVRYPDQCGDWHGDGLQGYDGAAVIVRNSTLELIGSGGCGGGTAPFFYPSGQGNTSVDVDGLLVKGGGYPFREGMPGTVKGLKIVAGSWGYGPIDVKCSAVTSWQADIVTVTADYQPTAVRAQPCNTEGGS